MERDGITVDHPRFIFPPKLLRGTYGPLYRACVARTFDRVVRSFAPDVVLSSWAYPDGWAATRLGRAAGLPVVVNVVGSDVLLAGPRRLRHVAAAVRAADGVLAASAQLGGRVIELGVNPDRVRAVHNGVNAAAFRPGDRDFAKSKVGLNPEDRVILFVGNFQPVKGPDVLLDACVRLSAAGRRFTCCLVGQGPMRAELERRAGRVVGKGTVRFVGAVEHAELPDWFRAADVFALPSRSEGVPNVLLEAAACDTPYVASRVGGVPEIAHLGRGRLVPAGDASQLADALAAVLDGPAGSPASAERPPVRSHAAAAADIAAFLRQTVRAYHAAHGHVAIEALQIAC